jgi:hypothetical protein
MTDIIAMKPMKIQAEYSGFTYFNPSLTTVPKIIMEVANVESVPFIQSIVVRPWLLLHKI